jgi:hypothetical protein
VSGPPPTTHQKFVIDVLVNFIFGLYQHIIAPAFKFQKDKTKYRFEKFECVEILGLLVLCTKKTPRLSFDKAISRLIFAKRLLSFVAQPSDESCEHLITKIVHDTTLRTFAVERANN